MRVCGVDPTRGDIAVSFVEDMKEFKYQEYDNSIEGFKDVEERIKDYSIDVVCIEGYGDAAKQFAIHLKGKGVKVYEINPLMLERLKESITEHKTDHIDAYTCALFPFFRRDLKELTLDMDKEGLKSLSRLYEKISKQITRYKNQLHAALNQGFGAIYKKIFPRLNKTSLNFYLKYSSYKDIAEASISDIRNTLKSTGSCMYKGKYGLKKAKQIKDRVNNIEYSDLNDFMEIQSSIIKSYCRLLLTLMEEKERIKRKIEETVNMLFPGYKEFFKSIKGLTELGFGRIMAEIQDINRFPDDGHLASYAGQSPKQFQSGTMNEVRNKKRYNRHLAHLIHQLACNNVIKGRNFYNDYIEAKKRYSKKIRAIKNIKRKMVRLLFYGLKEYTEYMQKNQIKREILYIA